jgi:hypothetical protein
MKKKRLSDKASPAAAFFNSRLFMPVFPFIEYTPIMINLTLYDYATRPKGGLLS